MDAKEETVNLLNKLWTKLQGLPSANNMELGGFFVLLIFILVIVLMFGLACLTCCCCRRTRAKAPPI